MDPNQLSLQSISSQYLQTEVSNKSQLVQSDIYTTPTCGADVSYQHSQQNNEQFENQAHLIVDPISGNLIDKPSLEDSVNVTNKQDETVGDDRCKIDEKQQTCPKMEAEFPNDDVKNTQNSKPQNISSQSLKPIETKTSGFDQILEICNLQFPSNIQLIEQIVGFTHKFEENEEIKEKMANICNKLMSEFLHLNHSISGICRSFIERENLKRDSSFSGSFESLLSVWKENMVRKKQTGKLSYEDEEMMNMESLNNDSKWTETLVPDVNFTYTSSSVVLNQDNKKCNKSHTAPKSKTKSVTKSDENYLPSLTVEKKTRASRRKARSPIKKADSSRGVARSCQSKAKDISHISEHDDVDFLDADDAGDEDEMLDIEDGDYLPGEDNLKCYVCNRSFDSELSLDLHKRKEHGSVKKCNACEKTFSSTEALKEHILTHSKYGKLTKVYSQPVIYQCQPCGLSFRRKFRYNLHLRSHVANQKFVCNVCEKSFASEMMLNKHKSINHSDTRCFKCPQCDKSFKTETPLKYHMMKHDGLLPYSCLYCENKYPTQSSRDVHQRTHSVEKPYMCSTCDKGFKTQYNLKKHSLLHAGEKNFQCDLCGQTFRQKSTLTSHRRVHTGEKPYICDVCGKAFTQSSILNMHKRVHTGYKPHKCSYCDSSFSCGASLRKHTTIHTGEKNFMCKVCGRCFARSQGLKHHERSHTGVKPYSCKECGKKFTCPKHVKRHMLMHTGEYPYTCNVCGKQFRQDYNMRVHMRVHSGDKPFPCTNCGRCFAYKQSLQMHAGHCVRQSGFMVCDIPSIPEIQ